MHVSLLYKQYPECPVALFYVHSCWAKCLFPCCTMSFACCPVVQCQSGATLRTVVGETLRNSGKSTCQVGFENWQEHMNTQLLQDRFPSVVIYVVFYGLTLQCRCLYHSWYSKQGGSGASLSKYWRTALFHQLSDSCIFNSPYIQKAYFFVCFGCMVTS